MKHNSILYKKPAELSNKELIEFFESCITEYTTDFPHPDMAPAIEILKEEILWRMGSIYK